LLTKLLYGITAVILALAIGGAAVQTHRLSKAENRAVEATKLADGYRGSLESLERAVAAQTKSEKAAREALVNRAKRAEELAAKTKKENHALQEALAASPDWTREPIPAGVLDAIRD
jgi:uncharacterized alpha/beta hydrolase family protein